MHRPASGRPREHLIEQLRAKYPGMMGKAMTNFNQAIDATSMIEDGNDLYFKRDFDAALQTFSFLEDASKILFLPRLLTEDALIKMGKVKSSLALGNIPNSTILKEISSLIPKKKYVSAMLLDAIKSSDMTQQKKKEALRRIQQSGYCRAYDNSNLNFDELFNTPWVENTETIDMSVGDVHLTIHRVLSLTKQKDHLVQIKTLLEDTKRSLDLSLKKGEYKEAMQWNWELDRISTALESFGISDITRRKPLHIREIDAYVNVASGESKSLAYTLLRIGMESGDPDEDELMKLIRLSRVDQSLKLSVLRVLHHFGLCVEYTAEDTKSETVLALEQYNAGKYSESVELLDSALTNPDIQYSYSELTEMFYQRGRAYKALGQDQKARDDFTKALKFKPDYEPARQELAEIERKAGESAKAAKNHEMGKVNVDKNDNDVKAITAYLMKYVQD